MMSSESIAAAVAEAEAHRQPRRAMRVTLECAHLRLLPWQDTIMGIGAQTGCLICPDRPTRVVVNIEETGVLHNDWYKHG